MTQVKSGIWTTEFWITTVMGVVAVLVNIGLLTLADSKTIEEVVKQVTIGVGMIVAAVLKAMAYIKARKEVKVEAEVTKQEAVKAVAAEPDSKAKSAMLEKVVGQ